eukprot:XP_001705092.1 Hypothetical protein GL50803_104227 [Giardia lamblia ATCC 50803]
MARSVSCSSQSYKAAGDVIDIDIDVHIGDCGVEYINTYPTGCFTDSLAERDRWQILSDFKESLSACQHTRKI